mgnify:CR=1 FL=1
MKAFIDSSFYISLIRSDDQNHKRALQTIDTFKNEAVIFFTSQFVVDEVATVLSMRVSKTVSVQFLKETTQEDFPIILPLDFFLQEEGRKLFMKQKDKNISMIDCYSAIQMRHQGIRKCFTFDRQFKKMGFEIL